MPSPTAGLGSEEAAARLASDGYNELPALDRRGFARIVWEVVRQPMFALLIGAGIVYLVLGDRTDGLLLLAFAALSILITIVQESRSERVLDALRNLASPRALVVRDGKRIHIAGREVVCGDLIVLSEGDRIAADAILVEAQDLLLDESLLTGESVPVRKLASLPGACTVMRAYGLRPDLFAIANVLSEEKGGGTAAYAKGAVEAIAELCHLDGGAMTPIRAQVDALAGSGVRVLGVAKSVPVNVKSAAELPDTPRGMEFGYLGLLGFADPLRANVPAAVAQCRSAGIRVLMITGDYPATASAIGRQAGLDSATVLTDDEIASMSDEMLAGRLKATSIFARIRPDQKLRIVESLKANGETVAMTGDGVNDAPAIKAAHIGIAMGGRGTEVAREASSIVLLDDDFGSIVTTIRLGRRIYDNLREAIEYIVAVHIPIAGLALLPLLLGLPLILTPIHIAFLEMIIDPACSMVFEAEAEEDDVMRRPPRDPTSPLLLPKRILWALAQGIIALAILSVLLILVSRSGMIEGDMRVLVFTSLVLINMGLILVNRSFKSSLVRATLQPNRALWILLGTVSAVMAIAIVWPPARTLFHFDRLHWDDLAICAGVGVSSLLVLEAMKSWWFHAPASRPPAH
jgi:Ca2+-transporting ATPase